MSNSGFQEWVTQAMQWQEGFRFPGIRRRKQSKPVPNTSIDDFVKEVDALQKDILSAKSRTATPQKSEPKSRKEPTKKDDVDDDLLKVAKVVFSNLRSAPNYYVKRNQIDMLAGKEQCPNPKKISRKEALRLAKEISIDFDHARFTPESFRKGVEAELRRETKPSLFARNNAAKKNREFGDEMEREP